MQHKTAKAHATFGPDASLLLLFAGVALTTALLGWLVTRLVLGASGGLLEQQGLRAMEDDCALIQASTDLADRLLAYATAGALVIIGARAIGHHLTQLWQTQVVAYRIEKRRVAITAPLAQVIAGAGLSGKVTIVDNDQPLAFCYGIWRRRIYISTRLIEVVDSEQELKAVLLHEGYHLRHFDPLKMAVAQAVTRAFFFLPVAADLYRHYLGMRELAADQEATKVQGSTRPLAAALYHMATAPGLVVAPPGAAHLMQAADREVMNARLDSLLGEANSYQLRLEVRTLALSALAIALTALLVAFSYAAHHGLVLLTIKHWLEGFC